MDRYSCAYTQAHHRISPLESSSWSSACVSKFERTFSIWPGARPSGNCVH